jgi:hypothetical protein
MYVCMCIHINDVCVCVCVCVCTDICTDVYVRLSDVA